MSKTRKLLIASIFLIALPAHATLIEATFSVDLPVFTEPNLDPLDQLFTANSITQLIGTARWDSADIPSYCAAGCSISPLATENTFATNIDSLFDTSPQWFNLITGPDVPNGIKLRLNLISWKILIGDADGVGSARGASYTLSLLFCGKTGPSGDRRKMLQRLRFPHGNPNLLTLCSSDTRTIQHWCLRHF